jgi:hypothetical protein
MISVLAYFGFLFWLILRPKSKPRIAVTLYALCLALMLSPVDIHFRRIGRINLRFLPVVYNLGASQKQRDLEKDGKRENVDFVVVRYQTAFMKTSYSLTFFY